MKSLPIFIVCLLASVSHAVNRLPDSSFELRASRGWFGQKTSGSDFIGNVGTLDSLLTNGAAHGNLCLLVPASCVIYSRAMYLTAGNYTNTFSAKTYSGTQGPYSFGFVNRGDLGTSFGTGSANFTGSWARYTNGFTASSNGLYWLCFTHNQNICAIDAIQVEAGAATDYAPMASVECGLSTGSTNNMWFAGDTPTFTLNFWNEGASVATRINYQVFDGWNSNLISANLSVLTPSGRTVFAIPLPDKYGHLRIMSRISTINDSYDETTACVYPFASNAVASATASTNMFLGGHPNASPFHATKELRAGRHWQRLLSPNSRNTRLDTVQPGGGAFSFDDPILTNTAGLFITLGNLTGNDQTWPSWAVTTSGTTNSEFPYIGMWDGMIISNYAYTVVNRYKLWVDYWELWNEPYQSGHYGVGPAPDSENGIAYTGTNLPINLRVATNYAKMVRYLLAGATNADPRPIYIAGAGAFGNGLWHLDYWTNLSAVNIHPWIHAISTHIPPQDQGTDPNAFHHADFAFTAAQGFHTNFIATGIRPVWQTESPMYSGIVTMRGMNAIWPSAYDIHASLDPAITEAARSKVQMLPLSLTGMIVSELLRDKGYGFQQWSYYDSRFFTDQAFAQNLNYAADYNNVDRQEVVALSIAQHMIRQGFGVIQNATATPPPTGRLLEMYAFTNASGHPVVAAWNAHRTNELAQVTNVVTIHDVMGNLVNAATTNIIVKRIPQYISSTTMTLAQLSNCMKFANLVASPDTLAPQVSFDIAPSGLWSGDTNATLVKWTGVDDSYTVWTNATSTGTATNVLFKIAIDEGSYSDYSMSNHMWLHHLSPGNHTIKVTAKDLLNNAAEYTYVFEPPPTIMNVQNLRVGEIVKP